MLDMLKTWTGTVEINNTKYDSIQSVPLTIFNDSETIHIKLYPKTQKAKNSVSRANDSDIEYEITVKAYMTKEASPEFDFMAQWNDNHPMPLRTMIGRKLKETRGMVYMELHGCAKPTITCYCCGKELTNPVSRHYGIGPVCLKKIGITRDISDIENIKEDLVNVTWTGWIIKSAILEEKEVK